MNEIKDSMTLLMIDTISIYLNLISEVYTALILRFYYILLSFLFILLQFI